VEKILLKFENTINKFGKKIKFLILDHIISIPSIICPIEAVTEFCHEKQIKVIIDAAHAVGQLDIDIKKVGCDAYFSNFHKWGFCPKSCTLLYVSDYFKEVIFF
jgi:selenocysteine lyase/cysteine desulfurase